MSSPRMALVTWVLIYAGMFSFALGWTVRPNAPALGWVLIFCSAVAVVAGIVLVWARSRMAPQAGE
jgi:vacuolar-type H+-ATPase subunit I/STV1